jgi:Fic family protein
MHMFTLPERQKKRDLEELHHLLVKDLGVAFGIRKGIVGITGTAYKPLGLTSQLEEALVDLLDTLPRMKDPYSRALLLLLGVSYVQPFEDGNKRSARLCANALLLANNLAPLSYRSVEEDDFKSSVLVFYEQQSLIAFKRIFIEQYCFSANNYMLTSLR